jgi:hypothetical protein
VKKQKKITEGKKHYGHSMQRGTKPQKGNNFSAALTKAFVERIVNKDLRVLRFSQRYC